MPVLDPQELDTRSKYHKPTEEKVELHERVRELYGDLAKELNNILPSGARESMAALDYLLDHSLMMANAAIARRG
jgi:hypothetical protein